MIPKIEVTKIEDFLRRIWAFEQLSNDQLLVLAKLVVVRNLKNGEILWLQGQKITHFTIVYSGQLRSVRGASSGSEKMVSTLSQGYHFGLAEMITQATSAVTISAQLSSVILYIDYKSMRKVLLSNSKICYRLMQTMARAIFGLTQELERASFESVHTRLARLIIRRNLHRSDPLAPHKNDAAITHEQLAQQIGVSRETVSRVLADFRKKKLIDTAYRKITILDRDGLMEYIDDYDQW